MCGIVGIHSHKEVAVELYESLIHLQHRGQDAAGILTCDHRFYSQQGLGLVRESFTAENIQRLKGNMGIGHTRYPTSGGYSEADIQPLWIGSPRGIALAHNGNIFNYEELAQDIRYQQHQHLNSNLDSEVILFLLASQLAKREIDFTCDEAFFNLLCEAVSLLFNCLEGAYSIIGMVIGKGLFAFRDPHGIRPLVWGSRANYTGRADVIISSETTPFYGAGFHLKGDVAPGEVMFINEQGKLFRRIIKKADFRPCVFEYIYFARPDAILNAVSVYRARLRMGQNLARQWKEKYPDILPDVVIPAPFTANTAALSFAHELGVRYSEGLYKNPFIGRTFIMPNQKLRSSSIRHKLTPQQTEIKNKKVLILDDSIVRGTTSKEIVKMIKEFGAKEIYFASAAPPIKKPCFYGIDMPSEKELIAAVDDVTSIAKFLGVDILIYQTEEDLIEAVTRKGEHHIHKPCMACMDGDYFCPSLNKQRIQELGQRRDYAKV